MPTVSPTPITPPDEHVVTAREALEPLYEKLELHTESTLLSAAMEAAMGHTIEEREAWDGLPDRRRTYPHACWYRGDTIRQPVKHALQDALAQSVCHFAGADEVVYQQQSETMHLRPKN